MSFQLGMSTVGDNIISAAKFLDQLPVGSVVRNGCSTIAAKGEGVHFVKLDTRNYDERWSWSYCDPKTYRPVGDPVLIENKFAPRDVFLPVQVVREGPEKEHVMSDTIVTPYVTNKDVPGMKGAVSAHYTIYHPGDAYELGNIDSFEDADRFAEALAGITKDVWHVIEHKFTQTTVSTYGLKAL